MAKDISSRYPMPTSFIVVTSYKSRDILSQNANKRMIQFNIISMESSWIQVYICAIQCTIEGRNKYKLPFNTRRH